MLFLKKKSSLFFVLDGSSNYIFNFACMKPILYIVAGCFLLFYNESKAQFNTVGFKEKRCKITINDAQRTKEEIGNGTKGINDSIALQKLNGTLKTVEQEERIGEVPLFAYPLKKIKVTSSFGYRKDPFTGKKRLHNGLDLRARNEEVYAMLQGEVIKTGEDKTSGKYVILKHGNIQISYCHLSKILVKAGVTVSPGETVAISGSTGRSNGPHLHITARFKGATVNPAIIISYFSKLIDNKNIIV